jgi:hypothetical protein
VLERVLFDYRRNLTRLAEWADVAGLVAGDSFRLRRLTLSCDPCRRARVDAHIGMAKLKGQP